MSEAQSPTFLPPWGGGPSGESLPGPAYHLQRLAQNEAVQTEHIRMLQGHHDGHFSQEVPQLCAHWAFGVDPEGFDSHWDLEGRKNTIRGLKDSALPGPEQRTRGTEVAGSQVACPTLTLWPFGSFQSPWCTTPKQPEPSSSPLHTARSGIRHLSPPSGSRRDTGLSERGLVSFCSGVSPPRI